MPASGDAVLDRVYDALGLRAGSLLRPSVSPTDDNRDAWASAGDWLTAASRMGADRVFFVDDDPVVVFSALPSDSTEADLVSVYRKAWSLARPLRLFLAVGEELQVYALSVPPPKNSLEFDNLAPLATVRRTAEVMETLSEYRRESLESGATFDSRPRYEIRADEQLMADVSEAAARLTREGLSPVTAHALVERVILVRYLEDRGVIDAEYLGVTVNLSADSNLVPIFGARSTFVECLLDKQLTYSIFEKLERDFNGDLFVVDSEERDAVSQFHLNQIRSMLTGEASASQQQLFLWAYDFSVVPTSLISSMYENFYHAGEAEDTSSTHYTPPELVEFTLTAALTEDVLRTSPRVCDPACGSGVFLVEAYRTIVRHEMSQRSRALTPSELHDLLLTRISGMDINPSAVRLAAFSLYLALLNYQSVSDIRAAGPLPPLIHREGSPRGPVVLAVADAFADFVDTDSFDTGVGGRLPWRANSFDVLVGNPPWDEPKGRAPRSQGETWAADRGIPIGDRSPSQLFLARSLELLRPGGRASMLVSSLVFLNRRTTTQRFRRFFLQEATLTGVVNFTVARRLFFSRAVSPFTMVSFANVKPDLLQGRLEFSNVWPTSAMRSTGLVAYGQIERRVVAQSRLLLKDHLWKVYCWGGNHDEALLDRLSLETKVRDLLSPDSAPGYGYQRGKGEPSELLKELNSLRTFEPWGPVESSWIESSPTGVKRQPSESLYEGQRILIRRGVKAGFGPPVRLEDDAYSFRHTTFAVPLPHLDPWMARLVYATLVSSTGRYFLFMTSGSWGVWHDSVTSDVLDCPVRLPESQNAFTEEIDRLVESLQSWTPAHRGDIPTEILSALDQRIYDLFDMSKAERSLVEDWMRHSLPASRGDEATWLRCPPVSGGTIDSIDEMPADLAPYLTTFLELWNARLVPHGSFAWAVYGDRDANVIGAVFETRSHEVSSIQVTPTHRQEWSDAVDRISAAASREGRTIASQGLIRIVSDTHLIILKRAQARFWTSSAAREDFEATLIQAMRLADS